MSHELELRYSIYIQASPEQIWEALTEPRLSTQYFPYAAIGGEWRAGSDYAMRHTDGSVVYEGKVLQADRPRLLLQTVNMKAIPAFVGHKEFTLEWLVEQFGDACKLTILHRGSEAKVIETLASHCPDTASGIKTLLETGKPLRIANRVEGGRMS